MTLLESLRDMIRKCICCTTSSDRAFMEKLIQTYALVAGTLVTSKHKVVSLRRKTLFKSNRPRNISNSPHQLDDILLSQSTIKKRLPANMPLSSSLKFWMPSIPSRMQVMYVVSSSHRAKLTSSRWRPAMRFRTGFVYSLSLAIPFITSIA